MAIFTTQTLDVVIVESTLDTCSFGGFRNRTGEDNDIVAVGRNDRLPVIVVVEQGDGSDVTGLAFPRITSIRARVLHQRPVSELYDDTRCNQRLVVLGIERDDTKILGGDLRVHRDCCRTGRFTDER